MPETTPAFRAPLRVSFLVLFSLLSLLFLSATADVEQADVEQVDVEQVDDQQEFGDVIYAPTTSGVLGVSLYEATGLKSEDFFGKNDPYVELWLDSNYKQRSTDKPGTNNPVWNEFFSFNVHDTSKYNKLYFRVLDKDTVSNDKIGSAKFDLTNVYKGQPFTGWIKLPAWFGLSSHGQLHLRIEFEPSFY